MEEAVSSKTSGESSRMADSDESGDEEEEKSESHVGNLQEELLEFRERWQRELKKEGDLAQSELASDDVAAIEEEAKVYFTKGMQAENDGDLYGAILYYRRAMQLVPDIESKMDFFQQRPSRERQDSESSTDDSVDEDLVRHFQGISIDDSGVCQPKFEQRAVHISSLPTEVLMYIFRWVVSSQLDLRSLEMLSQVCRGFYMCARDEGLWKSACHRMWGTNCGSSKKYGGWRRMFIHRPHLMFNGCYISRTTYVRPGEQSMDSFYRPFHTVAYFRYLRFVPDGGVVMVCSPEEPSTIVPKLRTATTIIQGMMKGYYRLSGSKVMCILKRVKLPEAPLRYKRRQQANQQDIDQTYTMEFEMTDSGRRTHCRLSWVSYSVCTVYKASGEETEAEFELKDRSYPPLFFSRVRSYTSSAEAPLE